MKTKYKYTKKAIKQAKKTVSKPSLCFFSNIRPIANKYEFSKYSMFTKAVYHRNGRYFVFTMISSHTVTMGDPSIGVGILINIDNVKYIITNDYIYTGVGMSVSEYCGRRMSGRAAKKIKKLVQLTDIDYA